MICKSGSICTNSLCIHRDKHECIVACSVPCTNRTHKSMCIPYVMSKPFNCTPEMLAREQERKMEQVTAIISKEPAPLTDHAKYCRLSKQAGSLCAIKITGISKCEIPDGNYVHHVSISPFDTVCARPEKQQPVELPKDPLEVLIKEFSGIICDYANGETYDIIKHIRTFAEKVRALK